MAEVHGSASSVPVAGPGSSAAIREDLTRVAGLGRLVLNAVRSRREYFDGKLHVDAEDVYDVLDAMATCGHEARELLQPDLGADWAHLWGATAFLRAEAMRWLEVHQGVPPEQDLAAAEVALDLVVETATRLSARVASAA